VIILRFGLSHDIDNYMPLVPSLCGHLHSCYTSRLPVRLSVSVTLIAE